MARVTKKQLEDQIARMEAFQRIPIRIMHGAWTGAASLRVRPGFVPVERYGRGCVPRPHEIGTYDGCRVVVLPSLSVAT